MADFSSAAPSTAGLTKAMVTADSLLTLASFWPIELTPD
jgi:hypothetical protein